MDLHELREELNEALSEIGQFVNTDEFQSLLSELSNTPPSERGEFVRRVVINKDELMKRHIHVPVGMQIQRSSFGDRRPTLFCITKQLSVDQNMKVTFTFDHE